MSVKRRDPVRYLEENGFALLREGKSHSIYADKKKTIPVKRHNKGLCLNSTGKFAQRQKLRLLMPSIVRLTTHSISVKY